MLEDLPALHGLRHVWCWERQSQPHVPTWSFTKVPRPELSPEENARLLSVYMRPWTLNPTESTRQNPLLSDLGKCTTIENKTIPVWTQLRSSSSGSTEDPCSTAGAREGEQNKRRRLSGKTRCKLSYATSWDAYIEGNIVSESSRRFITNLLAATAANNAAYSYDYSVDSNAEARLTAMQRRGTFWMVTSVAWA